MVRRYAEAVLVRHQGGRPEQFVWRERRYLVREVLAHWVDADPWWTSSRVARPAGLGAPGSPESPASADLGFPEAAEGEFWRVRAGRGARDDGGVYELCLSHPAERWSLVRVHD